MSAKSFCDLDEVVRPLYKARLRLIEGELIRIVEVLEGRVPTIAEVTRHGMQHIYQDGTHVWTWKGREIIYERPPQFTDGKVAYQVDVLKLA